MVNDGTDLLQVRSATGRTARRLFHLLNPLKVGMSITQRVAGMKVHLKSKKFRDHISQAQMFWNSQTPPERIRIIAAFGFELDHCDNPIVYNRIIERLCDIDIELAQAAAAKAGAPSPAN